MRHTDYRRPDDGRRLICYGDGASRFVAGWGALKEVAAGRAIEVLNRAIAEHGKPKSILADRGSHFYATESEKKVKGISEFEKRPESLGIRRILARVPTRRPTASWSACTARYRENYRCSLMWQGLRAAPAPSTRRQWSLIR